MAKMWTLFCWVLLSLLVLPAGAQVATDNHSVGLTIPEIALLDVEPNTSTISLALTPPTEAGLPLTASTAATNNSKWLNYTSALAPSSTNRTVTVQVTSGTVPSGINLLLQAGSYSGSGAGTTGTSVGQIALNNTAQNLITGIGGCYTGDGSSTGHRLTYTLAISNYAQLNFSQSTNLQITFTISD